MRLVGLLASVALVPSLAAAQQESPSTSATGNVSASPAGGSARTMARDWMIPPAGDLVIGGSITFLTADDGPMDRELDFTDAVFVGVQAHYAIAGRAELSLA